MTDPLSLFGFAKDVISWIIKFVQPKIEVKPSKIRLSKSEWRKDGFFIVCNKTESPLFDTQILIWLPADLGSSPPLSITKIEDQDKDANLVIGNIALSTGAVIVKGNANNRGVVLVQLQYLSPKGCKRVYFSLEQQIKGEVALKAVSTSKEPSQNFSGTNKGGMPFKPPVSMTLSSLSFWMKKNN